MPKRKTTEELKLQNQERMLGVKRKLLVFGNIGIGHHQTKRDERKKIRQMYLWKQVNGLKTASRISSKECTPGQFPL